MSGILKCKSKYKICRKKGNRQKQAQKPNPSLQIPLENYARAILLIDILNANVKTRKVLVTTDIKLRKG